MKTKNHLIRLEKKKSIVTPIELLLLFVVGYNFASWGKFESLPSQLLGLFSCIYVINNWVTTRSSFDFYQMEMFFTDIIIIFLSMNIPNSLENPVKSWGYDPFFWILMGGMELVNVYWNYQLYKVSPSEKGRSGMLGWLIVTTIVMFGCFGLYFYLQYYAYSIEIGQILATILTLTLLALTVKWNLNRYKMEKSKGISFLD